MNGSTAEDKRFEAALRIFIAEITANIEKDCIDIEATKGMADGAVLSADLLLAALRKEKP